MRGIVYIRGSFSSCFSSFAMASNSAAEPAAPAADIADEELFPSELFNPRLLLQRASWDDIKHCWGCDFDALLDLEAVCDDTECTTVMPFFCANCMRCDFGMSRYSYENLEEICANCNKRNLYFVIKSRVWVADEVLIVSGKWLHQLC